MARQLTMDEREVISRMLYANELPAAIARRLGRHRSSVGREIERNSDGGGGYSAVEAQRRAEARRRNRPLTRKLDRPEMNEEVRRSLARYWSPDQIAGRLKQDHPGQSGRWVSHQTIYDWLRRDEHRDPWEGCLRFGGRRRKKNDRRGKIPRTVEIDKRPKIVERRSRFGDWEGDTMVGAKHCGALVTHVERKSGYLLAAKAAARRCGPVNQATKRLFANIPSSLRKTLTLDNGKEFAHHEAMGRRTGLDIYFAQPYAAWQRGVNENTNGLLRQFFPKGTNFTQVSHHDVRLASEQLNNRPRKRLGYRTPNEVLQKHLGVAIEN
ncbi:MAG: IS30 family transposase [Planctomycetes bacterium]|nr:IS30 family transposase [Planctomycetota bacterium]